MINKEKTAKIFHKIFQRADLSDDECIMLLDEWGRKENFDPNFSHEKWRSAPLLVACGSSISANVLDWMIDEHGKEILLHKDNNDKSVAFSLFLLQFRNSSSSMINKIFSSLSVDENESLIDSVADLETINDGFFMGIQLSSWEGPLKRVAVLLFCNQYDAAGKYIAQKPELFKESFNGRTLSSMMCTTTPGWNEYLGLGGTIFDPVFINPLNDEQTDTATPLWLWLIQSKKFHPGIKGTLSSLLDRVQEDRPPNDDELVISDEDWNTLVENKFAIEREVGMIMFEEEINQDWKLARKTNKAWRDWRSNEGATFMHWVASNQVADFIRSQHKIKLNHPLIKTKDNAGNDIMSYIFVGLATAPRMGWKRERRFVGETYPAAMKDIIDKNLIDVNPKKGVIAQLLDASDSSFFQRLSQPPSRSLDSYLSKIPLNCMWNGLDGSFKNDMFLSSERMNNLGKILSQVFTYSVSKDPLFVENCFDHMDNDLRFQLLTSLFSGSNNMTHASNTVYEKFLKKCMEKDINLPQESIDAMLSFVNRFGKNYYGYNENGLMVKNYISAQSMKKTLSSPSKNHDTGEESPAPVLKKKRRLM